MSLGSEAGVYAHWHLGQAHQTSFKVGACGYSVMSRPSTDRPVGWVLWHRPWALALPRLSACWCLLVELLKSTLRAGTSFWAHLILFFSSSAGRPEGEEPSFPLGSCLGPADDTEPLLYISVSAEAAQGGLDFLSFWIYLLEGRCVPWLF